MAKFQLVLLMLCCMLSSAVKIGISHNSIHTTTSSTTPDISATTLLDNNIEDSTTTQPFIVSSKNDILKTTATAAITTTTSTPMEEITETATSVKPIVNDVKHIPNYRYCSCDIQPDTCDINCCCDRDCSMAALHVFNCPTKSKQWNMNKRFKEFQHMHDLPLCSAHDGWLCVFRANIKSHEEKYAPLNLDTSKLYKWPSSLYTANLKPVLADRDFYKFNEPILLLNTETQEVITFDIPISVMPPHCQIREPIRHLYNFKSNCLTNVPQMQTHLWQLFNLTDQAKVLKSPQMPANQDWTLAQNNLFNMLVCHKTIANDSEHFDCANNEHNNSISYIDETSNYGVDIELHILHNYTHLQAILVALKTFIIASETKLFWQHYSINFLYKQHTDMPEILRPADFKPHTLKPASGPLGYLLGKAIIIAKLMTADNTENEQQILDYFHSDASTESRHYTLPLFTKRDYKCYKNFQLDFAINYGISEIKQCDLHMPPFQPPNCIAYCERIQAAIMEQLLPYNVTKPEQLSELYVSKLGRPQPELDNWLQMQLKNYDYANILADFNEQTQSCTCRNMLLNANYEFHITKLKIQGIAHQPIVQHAAIMFGQRHDLEFEQQESVELPLTLTVMFYESRSNASAYNLQKFHFYVILMIFMLFY